MSEPQKKSQSGPLLKPFTYRVLVAVALGTAAIVFLYLLFNAIRVLLLLFSGILLAVLLNSVSNWVHEHSPHSRRAALALVIVSILLLLALFGWMVTPGLVRQADQLGDSLTESLLEISHELRSQDWGRRLLEQVQGFPGNLAQGSDILSGITGFFSRTLGAVVDFAIFLFIGIFLAVNPDVHLHGLTQLIPVSRRDKGREVLNLLGRTLRWWLVGRLASMTVVGALSILGLMLLNVPLAFILGFLAGLLSFIPILGPVLALIPAVLVALGNDAGLALYVLLLYAGIQVIESYILTPLIQERTISMPPVVTILSQVLAGLIVGPLGVALAQPLAAVAIVLVKVPYVEDVLHDRTVEADPTPSKRRSRWTTYRSSFSWPAPGPNPDYGRICLFGHDPAAAAIA